MKKKSTNTLMLLTLFVVTLCTTGLAQQEMKIGVVNSQEVLEKSAEGKRIMAQLQETDKQNQEKVSKLDDEIRALQNKANTQRLTLTQEAMANLASDIERKQTDRKRLAEDAYRDMQDMTNRLFQRVQNELLPIIDALGKERGFDVIFDLYKSGAIYFNPAIDMTAEVIKRYDASKTG